MQRPTLRAGPAWLIASGAVALAGCGRGVTATGSGVSQPPAMETPAVQAPAVTGGGPDSGATLDPNLQASLNAIGDQIAAVGDDLQSASPSPEGDPSQ
jgi:hypothetical protein